MASTFDRNPSYVHLHDSLGEVDPLIRSLALNLLDELTCDDPQQGYLEDMMHLMLCRALRLQSNVRNNTPAAAHVLASASLPKLRIPHQRPVFNRGFTREKAKKKIISNLAAQSESRRSAALDRLRRCLSEVVRPYAILEARPCVTDRGDERFYVVARETIEARQADYIRHGGIVDVVRAARPTRRYDRQPLFDDVVPDRDAVLLQQVSEILQGARQASVLRLMGEAEGIEWCRLFGRVTQWFDGRRAGT
jgi:hypothetical protein